MTLKRAIFFLRKFSLKRIPGTKSNNRLKNSLTAKIISSYIKIIKL